MKLLRRLVVASTAAAATVAALMSLDIARAQTSGPQTCPATFHVLHDDRIGQLELPAGHYELKTAGRSCAEAAELFADFLQDYNGVLPRAWDYAVLGVGHGEFLRGDSGVELEVRRVRAASGGHVINGGGSHGHLACPGSFSVLNDDRIGRLRLPSGDYRLTRLGTRVSCAKASKLFTRFLNRPAGNIGRKWTLLPKLAEFVRGSTTYGFRVKRIVD